MPSTRKTDKAFIEQLEVIIEENFNNEQFGVSELADKAGMSRSNLLRKVKKITSQSVSQFIREVRLKHAMQMLQETSLTVSEIAFKTGFNSTSYFIKCFGDLYGYPPGETAQHEGDVETGITTTEPGPKHKRTVLLVSVFFLIIIVVAVFYFIGNPFAPIEKPEKSIAVLPFKNDSNDSSNVYIVNGLMEAVLNNLQKIKELRVVSRTSVEKYRNNPKTIEEVARELDVNYVVEGSGQKIGDQIMLNIQLIEAPGDRHLWAEQYNRQVNDIFTLQNEIARNIADKVEVIITPVEQEQIGKIPTDNLVAYDHFLKGLDLLYRGTPGSLEEAIGKFHEAIKEDAGFARAHAGIAISYYLLDATHAEKQYSEEINYYADKALLLDSRLPQSLMAKAFFYMNSGENELAIPYLEKALEYNPNSALVINTLADFYARIHPNTEKYLEYALMDIKLDIASHDSVTASFIYLHLSNALVQSGFVEEAEINIDKSLAYYPQNIYSRYVKPFIRFAGNKDLEKLRTSLLEVHQQDTNQLDVLQEVAKVYYYLGDYQGAYRYYKRFNEIREYLNMDIYRGEDAKIGLVMTELGKTEQAEKYFARFLEYASNDQSVYKNLSLAAYYAYHGDTREAIKHLELFSEEENFTYWIILFVEDDPLMANLRDLPEFREILDKVEKKFRDYHKRVELSLRAKNLI
jgi:TolB-like protein/AraC-like DNA-binding protein/Tfp pilus assembly protein PilF